MPNGFQALDQGTPELNSGMSTEDKMGEILSKFVILLESLKYVLTNLGKENFNETSLEEITEPIMGQITDMEGNVAELALTAMGLQLDVGNLNGDLTSLSVTVDGMRVADETGSYTIIDGDKLTSFDRSTLSWVVIENGQVILQTQGQMPVGGLYFEANTSKIVLKSDWGMPLKIVSAWNLSIDSEGTIYIGASSGYSGNVNIGDGTGIININGAIVNINGVPQ